MMNNEAQERLQVLIQGRTLERPQAVPVSDLEELQAVLAWLLAEKEVSHTRDVVREKPWQLALRSAWLALLPHWQKLAHGHQC